MKFCYVSEIAGGPIDVQYHGGIGVEPDNSVTQSYLDRIEREGFFAERQFMEKTPKYKQIIPAIVLFDKSTGKYVFYQRQAKHTEQRLAGLWTVAFGGHIDPDDDDMHEDCTIKSPTGNLRFGPKVTSGLKRELKEETGIVLENMDSLYFRGFVYDPSNSVGKVHLGLCFILDLDSIDIESIKSKSEIADAKLLSSNPDNGLELEGWAKIILRVL